MSDLAPNPFTNNAAGREAKQIADDSPVYVFPTRDGDQLGVGNNRQANMIDMRHGYFSNNPLGLWVHVFVSYTDRRVRHAGRPAQLSLSSRTATGWRSMGRRSSPTSASSRSSRMRGSSSCRSGRRPRRDATSSARCSRTRATAASRPTRSWPPCARRTARRCRPSSTSWTTSCPCKRPATGPSRATVG